MTFQKTQRPIVSTSLDTSPQPTVASSKPKELKGLSYDEGAAMLAPKSQQGGGHTTSTTKATSQGATHGALTTTSASRCAIPRAVLIEKLGWDHEELERSEVLAWFDRIEHVTAAIEQENEGWKPSFDVVDLIGIEKAYDPAKMAECFVRFHPKIIIPEAVDAKLNQKTLADAYERQLKAEERRKKDEEELEERLAYHESERSTTQRFAPELLEASGALVGKHRWCPSGGEDVTGETKRDKKWYAEHYGQVPKKLGGDVRVHQKSKGGFESENAFARWLRGCKAYDPKWPKEDMKEPQAGERMNCWEAVFFAAYKAGLVSKAKLIDIHKEAASASDYYGALLGHLNFGLSVSIDNGLEEAQPGDILFFDEAEHVALYKGGGKMLHLWHDGQSSAEGTLREEPIEAFARLFSDIRYAPSPFKK